jgi:[ribosomal protein S18]-alanine N-acetyltransferase
MSGDGREATVPALHIRPAEPNDLAMVVGIERQAFSDPWSAASFRDLVGRDYVTFDVATDESRVLGYSVVYVMAGEAEVANLAVGAEARRRGVGAALLQHAVDRLVARGVRTLFLEVRASNTAARALYDAFGFETIGRRARYYVRPVEDALVLRRALG